MATAAATTRQTGRSAASAQGIVVISMMVASGVLYKRSSGFTTTQNIGHATGLLVTTIGLVFLADIGGGRIAAGLAILIVLAVYYKGKTPTTGSANGSGSSPAVTTGVAAQGVGAATQAAGKAAASGASKVGAGVAQSANQATSTLKKLF